MSSKGQTTQSKFDIFGAYAAFEIFGTSRHVLDSVVERIGAALKRIELDGAMMYVRTTSFLPVLLLALLSVEPVSAQELLQDVDPAHAARLTEYNSVFVQEATYTASRYRIVRPNAEVLLSNGDISITPFANVESIRVTPEKIQRTVDGIYWFGRIQTGRRPPPDATPEQLRYWREPSALIQMQRFDLDESGNALLSRENRFRFSPRWRFDERDNPVLSDTEGGAGAVVSTGPPKTPQEIAEHKRLLKLRKHAIASVSATFSSPDGTRFVITPLRFTPGYSLVVQEDPAKTFAVLVEPLRPGQRDPRTSEDIARAEEYRRFVESLPRAEGKPIKGDVP